MELDTVTDSLDLTLTIEHSVNAEMSNEMKNWYVLIIFWCEIFLIGGLPGNIMTILAFVKFPSLHNPTNYWICSLAVSDLVACIILQPFTILHLTTSGQDIIRENKYVCLCLLWVCVSVLMISTAHMLVITLDRLLAVYLSLRYLMYLTEKVALRFIIALWLITLAFSSLPILGLNHWETTSPCKISKVYPVAIAFMVNMSVMTFVLLAAIMNLILAWTACKKVRVQPAGMQADPSHIFRGSFKITKMLLILVGLRIMVCMPFICLSYMVQIDYGNGVNVPKQVAIIHELSMGLMMSNAVLSPCVYAWRDGKFRQCYKKLLGATLHNEESHASSTTVHIHP